MKRIKLSPNSAEALRNGSTNVAEPGSRPSDDPVITQQHQLHMKEKPQRFVRREMNPMKIDEVLEVLFSFCPVDTLKNCRLVSKQWKDVSLRAWRHKAILHPGKNVEGLQNIQKYVKLLKSKSKMYEALQLQLKNYPFKNFRIQSSLKEYLRESAKPISNIARRVVLRDFRGKLVLVKEFLSKFQSLQNLEFENSELNGITPGPYQILSNVKHLKISRNNKASGFGHWSEFFECIQHLESFCIDYRTPWDYMVEIWGALEAIQSIRTDGGRGDVLPLKELEVMQVPQNQIRHAGSFENDVLSIVNFIIQPQFPLERLTFHIVWDVKEVIGQYHPLLRILRAYKDTLQYLKTSAIFSVESDMALLRCHLQKKPNLEKLRMEALKEVHLCNGLLGLSILVDLELPNLRKLVINSGEFPTVGRMNHLRGVQLQFPETAVYGRLETLDFLDNGKIPGPKTIRALKKMMPNLVNLTIPLDKQTFGIVCENFRGLKTLNVLAAQCRYDELDDESLTGISKGEDPQGPRKPNLTDLVHLTNLSIACETEFQGNAPFTDHSVVHGLFQLPKLYSLSIRFKEISDENKRNLLNHVKGNVDIQVTTKGRTEIYCDIEIDMTSPDT